jgi:hypothetical protein
MFVALSNGVMLLSEIIIIYLAAAAPFGVADFLQRPASVPRTRSLLKATGAALLWPLALLSRSLVQKKFTRRKHQATLPEVSSSLEVSTSRELRIDDARRALLSSLYSTEDLAREISTSHTAATTTRSAVRETITSVERYIGLTLAVAELDEEASERAPRETELCRISGRTGDDLRIAARCHARRNDARLRAHQAQSRLALRHALCELREVFENTLPQAATDSHAARPLFLALIETYARALALLSLLEDERNTQSIARLLDAARVRLLRRTESLNLHAAPESPTRTDTTGNVNGDAPCTTSIPQTNPQPQTSPTHTLRAHG